MKPWEVPMAFLVFDYMKKETDYGTDQGSSDGSGNPEAMV
jgi:hypothetical protein